MKKSLEEVKDLLIVVDMVNGFVREGAMSSQNIEHIVPEVEKLVKEFTESDDKQVVFVKDTHENNAMEFKRYPIHCLKGTSESDNVGELKKYEKDAIIHEKNSTSAIFPNNLLINIDKMKKLEKVVIVGCCTDICDFNGAMGLANYLDQWNRRHIIRVHEDAIATYAEDARQEYVFAAKLLMEHQGIQLVKKAS